MSFENLSWLLIGTGIGVTLGESNIFIICFGIIILSLGFILNYQEDKKRRAMWKYDSKKSKK